MSSGCGRLTVALSALFVAGLFISAAAQAKTTKDGIYTAEQATRGAKVYADSCASCHGDDLSGGGFAPALVKDEFLSAWTGQKLDDLYGRIKESMPADNPGTLSAEANADLLAFVLKTNGFAAGAQALPSDPAALKQIAIAKP
jgi:mono/diheme cytochrome c family protein